LAVAATHLPGIAMPDCVWGGFFVSKAALFQSANAIPGLMMPAATSAPKKAAPEPDFNALRRWLLQSAPLES
jgi:hypothetical protein